jgi:hypothetical protein
VKADSAQTKLHIAGGFVSVDNSGCKVQLSTETCKSLNEIPINPIFLLSVPINFLVLSRKYFCDHYEDCHQRAKPYS